MISVLYSQLQENDATRKSVSSLLAMLIELLTVIYKTVNDDKGVAYFNNVTLTMTVLMTTNINNWKC